MSSDDSFDDLSFPEISSDIWAGIHEREALETSKPNTPSILPPPPLTSENTPSLDDGIEEILWENYPEPTQEDWVQLASDLLSGPVHPESSQEVGDIEDFPSNDKKSVSVSELTYLLWCEVKARYDVLGLKYRGLEKRLETFESVRRISVDNQVVVKKTIIRVDKDTAKARDDEAKEGIVSTIFEALHEVFTRTDKQIHRELEEEVSKRVDIRPKGSEETLALRIINMIIGLTSLKNTKIWRELPVFGRIKGLMVNGIIDELTLSPHRSSVSESENAPQDGHKISITDTKTRSASYIPKTPSDNHKLQLMLYKKLLDGLLSPTFEWISYFEFLSVDPYAVFRDGFIAQMIDLAGDGELEDRLSNASCLLDLTFAWKASVDDLRLVMGEVDSDLSITYRPASRETEGAQCRKKSILGTTHFAYDEGFFQEKLKEIFELRQGLRQPRGADIHETWKCDSCEYKMDCEWREEQAQMFKNRSIASPVPISSG